MTSTAANPSTACITLHDVQQPLAGLTVVEMFAIGPVPFAGRILAQLGARVIRVSPPKDPGLGLGLPPNPKYDVLNHGKEVVVVNLKTDEGKAHCEQLLAQADVLIEGFRPGVLERMGMAPQRLLADHPRLVIGRLSGWGSEGPLAPRAGHDINYLALTGALHAMGSSDDPMPPLNLVADFGGGTMHLLLGVLTLLVRRGISGQGGVIDTSIIAGTHSLNLMFHGLVGQGVWQLKRASNLLDGGLPFYRCYRTACGGHVAVGPLESKFYAEMLRLTGLDGVLDPKNQYKPDTWPATTAAFEQAFASKTRDEWAALAEGMDACVAPVLTFTEAADHPHNRANRWFTDDQIGASDVLRFQDMGR